MKTPDCRCQPADVAKFSGTLLEVSLKVGPFVGVCQVAAVRALVRAATLIAIDLPTGMDLVQAELDQLRSAGDITRILEASNGETPS